VCLVMQTKTSTVVDSTSLAVSGYIRSIDIDSFSIIRIQPIALEAPRLPFPLPSYLLPRHTFFHPSLLHHCFTSNSFFCLSSSFSSMTFCFSDSCLEKCSKLPQPVLLKAYSFILMYTSGLRVVIKRIYYGMLCCVRASKFSSHQMFSCSSKTDKSGFC